MNLLSFIKIEKTMQYLNSPKWLKSLIILLLASSLLPVAKGQSPALTIDEVYQAGPEKLSFDKTT